MKSCSYSLVLREVKIQILVSSCTVVKHTNVYVTTKLGNRGFAIVLSLPLTIFFSSPFSCTCFPYYFSLLFIILFYIISQEWITTNPKVH